MRVALLRRTAMAIGLCLALTAGAWAGSVPLERCIHSAAMLAEAGAQTVPGVEEKLAHPAILAHPVSRPTWPPPAAVRAVAPLTGGDPIVIPLPAPVWSGAAALMALAIRRPARWL